MKSTINLLVPALALALFSCKRNIDDRPGDLLSAGSLASTATNSTVTPINPDDLIWSGNASSGTGVFGRLEFQDIATGANLGSSPSPNGSFIRAEADAEEGTVWHFRKAPLDGRAEVRDAKNFVAANGQTYYIGFKFKKPGLMESHALFQWKAYGTPMLQNIPLDMYYGRSKVAFEYRAENTLNITHLFAPAIDSNRWHGVVIRIVTSSDSATGRIQVWWDGSSTPANLLTGGDIFTGRTFDGTSIDPKWGYYNRRSDDGHIYFSQMKIGKTYESVAPLDPETNVIVYRNCNYDGAVILAPGDYTMAQLATFGVRNDDISSIKIPAGQTVTLYENSNFSGASVILTGNTSCLISNGWNDRVSSLKIE